jgi:glycosyltransferase involved in cell wall biosynthesis
VLRILDGFQPQVVLSVMQHACYYDAAYGFARAQGLPLVAVIHDVNEEFDVVFDWARPAARRRDALYYRYAAHRLCISPEMEALCAELYGVRGEVLYPNRDTELAPRPIADASTLKRGDRLSIGFVGNLNYGYGDELLRLLPAFRMARVCLVVFSRPPGPSCAALLDARDCCEYRGFVPSAEAWEAIKTECDAVILPYPNPAGSMERLYRYHFPSKLPEYLALGMPVIVTGPDYATGVKWALRNPGAVIVRTTADPTELAECFEQLRSDARLRLSIAMAGDKAGSRDFDPTAIRSQFLQIVSQAARNAPAGRRA